MSTKKKGLAETFMKNKDQLQQTNQPEETTPIPDTAEPKPKKTRDGKRHIGGYYDEQVWAQLKIMSIEKGGLTLQDMLAEALNNYFKVNDKPPIAK